VEQEFVVNQTLHGYSEGHRLLASSDKLSRETSWDMQVISDFSGRLLVTGFESYITGYPLPEISSYALARTWYAQEMRRPGSVWTHTLLIKFADLARVSTPAIFLELFVRPKEANIILYGSPILFRPHGIAERTDLKEQLDASRAILALLYSQSDPVFVPASLSTQYETLVLAIWAQQWPRLRRSFSFCTGSLTPRQIRGKALDLQIVPDSFRLSNLCQPFVESLSVLGAGNMPDWLQLALMDLTGLSADFREYLIRYGADTRADRLAFPVLAQTFHSSATHPRNYIDAKRLVDQLSQGFPDPDDAISLKTSLLAAGPNSDKSIDEEAAMMEALISAENLQPFARVPLKIRERCQIIVARLPTLAEHLLHRGLHSKQKVILQEVIDGVAGAITPQAASLISADDIDLLIRLVYANPHLTASPAIWRAVSHDRISDVITAAKSLVDSPGGEKIVLAILESSVRHIGSSVYTEFGPGIVTSILDWATVRGGRQLHDEWMDVLCQEPNRVAKWIAIHPQRAERILPDLDRCIRPSHVVECTQFRPVKWLNLVRLCSRTVGDWRSQYMVAFAFDCAIISTAADAWRLALAAFIPLHEALAQSRVERPAWQLMEVYLPRSWWLRDWDKCQLLRRGLLFAFETNDWPVEELQGIRSYKGLWKDLVTTYRAMRGKREISKTGRHAMDTVMLP